MHDKSFSRKGKCTYSDLACSCSPIPTLFIWFVNITCLCQFAGNLAYLNLKGYIAYPVSFNLRGTLLILLKQLKSIGKVGGRGGVGRYIFSLAFPPPLTIWSSCKEYISFYDHVFQNIIWKLMTGWGLGLITHPVNSWMSWRSIFWKHGEVFFVMKLLREFNIELFIVVPFPIPSEALSVVLWRIWKSIFLLPCHFSWLRVVMVRLSSNVHFRAFSESGCDVTMSHFQHLPRRWNLKSIIIFCLFIAALLFACAGFVEVYIAWSRLYALCFLWLRLKGISMHFLLMSTLCSF